MNKKLESKIWPTKNKILYFAVDVTYLEKEYSELELHNYFKLNGCLLKHWHIILKDPSENLITNTSSFFVPLSLQVKSLYLNKNYKHSLYMVISSKSNQVYICLLELKLTIFYNILSSEPQILIDFLDEFN